MAKVWADFGIAWTQEPVSKQMGDHATDKKIIGTAEMPIVEDLDKFVAHFGAAVVLGIMDGTSVRVMAQDVNRRLIQKGQKGDAIRDAIYNRLIGTRNASRGAVTVTVTVYKLPDGTEYKGSDLVEYQQAYTAALVDLGTPADVAMQIGSNQKF